MNPQAVAHCGMPAAGLRHGGCFSKEGSGTHGAARSENASQLY